MIVTRQSIGNYQFRIDLVLIAGMMHPEARLTGGIGTVRPFQREDGDSKP